MNIQRGNCLRTILFFAAAFLFYFPPLVAGNPPENRRASVSFGEADGKSKTVKRGDTVTVYVTCSPDHDGRAGAHELSLYGILRGSASGSALTVSGTADTVGEFELTGACYWPDAHGPLSDYAVLKVIDFEIRVAFDDDFEGRARNRAGIRERGRVLVEAKDGSDIFPLEGLAIRQGGDSLELTSVNTMRGTANFRASFNGGIAIIEAELKGGVVGTYEIEVVMPNGVAFEREPGTGIYHRQGHAGCGFKARAYLQPNDVSFQGLRVKEGYARASISGYFSYQIGVSDVHPAGNWFVLGPAVPGKGTRDTAVDIIMAASNNHTPYTDGKFTWAIPWMYEGEGRTEVEFAIVYHVKEIDATGRVAISKGGASASAGLNDPTSDF